MKKIIFLVMFLTSSLSFSSPTWIEYLFKVDSPQDAAKIVAATDKFMSSDFVKNNFKGSLHLNAYIAGGIIEETHSFAIRTKQSNVEDIIEATEDLNKAIKDTFPGQFGLSERMAGGGMQTHLYTVGYESLAEMEQWEDSEPRDAGVSPFDKEMDKLVEWHEREIVRNIRVYDSAMTLQDFVE